MPAPGCRRFPVGTGIFATLVEILHVFALQRFDLGLDERVHLGEHSRKVVGEGEIHVDSLLKPVQRLLPNPRQCGDGVLVADLDTQAGCAHEDAGEVLEQQGDGRCGVLGVELAAMSCSWARRTDAATMSIPKRRNSFCTAANRGWVAASCATAIMIPMFCLNMFQ